MYSNLFISKEETERLLKFKEALAAAGFDYVGAVDPSLILTLDESKVRTEMLNKQSTIYRELVHAQWSTTTTKPG